MPAHVRAANTRPHRTPSQERVLLARLEAARQVYNACLGKARTRARLVRESKAFQRAQTLPKDAPERANASLPRRGNTVPSVRMPCMPMRSRWGSPGWVSTWIA
jgi:hypothetical protein